MDKSRKMNFKITNKVFPIPQRHQFFKCLKGLTRGDPRYQKPTEQPNITSQNGEMEFQKTTTQRHVLSPKRFLRKLGRGMALIRSDGHDTRSAKAGNKHHKDAADEGQNDVENTYISYRDSEADIEYILKRNTVPSKNKSHVVDTPDGSLKLNRNERKERTGNIENNTETVKESGFKQDRNLENDGQTFEKTSDEHFGQVKVRTKYDDKTRVLEVFNNKNEDKAMVTNAQSAGMNKTTNSDGLEDAKNKAFGKKRILTETLANAYQVGRTENDDGKHFHCKKTDVMFTNTKSNIYNNHAASVVNVDMTDCSMITKEDNAIENTRLVPKDASKDKHSKGNDIKNKNHYAAARAHADIESQACINKIAEHERKVHKYIDDIDETIHKLDDTIKSAYDELNMSWNSADSVSVDTQGKTRSDEHSIASVKVEKQGTTRPEWRSLESVNVNSKEKTTRSDTSQTEAAGDSEVNSNRVKQRPWRRNMKDKLSNKDIYATESRAALRAESKANVLHRRHASEGTLDRNLESLFIGPKWRPLSVRSQEYIAIVAVDFGTAYSGYAYCFTSHPETIYMMRKPEGGDPGIYNQKTPTSILLTPDGNFHSFGYAARDFFHDLEPKEAQKWMYFERFKMMLLTNQVIGSDTKLVSENGHEASALTVFSYGLAYFKDHALRELSDQTGRRITCDDIKWVITVPAIWRASAKQFMRQAAYKAGIAFPEKHDNLLIALEPEAASLYCLRMRLLHPAEPRVVNDNDRFSTSASLESLFIAETDVGIRYMIVDCGGGTTDITVHEIGKGGRLKEIHKAVGGPFGSLGIDREFELLLCVIFGKDTIDSFKTKIPAGWVDLMTGFESRKRGTGPYRTTPITVSLPFSFMEFLKRRKGYSAESAVKKYGSKDVTYTSSGMLRLSPDLTRRLFQPTTNSIKQEIGNVLNHPDTRGLSYLLLVGGLAESSMLQHEIRKEFGHILKIIIPQGVSTITAKGAVLFGLNPDVIIERRSRMTYGVGVLRRIKPGIHPDSKRILKDGIAWCSDILDRFVSADQCIAVGETVVRSYTPVRQGQTSTIINIYSTERNDAEFITDRGVIQCGTLRLSLDPDDEESRDKDGAVARRREIRASMSFGDTEIKVTALDLKTGKTVNAGIDFLNA